MSNGWTGAADGTLDERVYYCQNWRADVVALVGFDGDTTMLEWVKYSAYGVPFGMPAKDADSDGDYDSADDTVISGWGSYDVRGDVNLDGTVDGSDTATMQALGRGVLTSSGVGNRKGYAGYEGDAKLSAKWHVRHRVLDSVLGIWLMRDPLGTVDGPNLYALSAAHPVRSQDATGLCVKWPWSSMEIKEGIEIPWTSKEAHCRFCCSLADSALSGGDTGGVICCETQMCACFWPGPPPDNAEPNWYWWNAPGGPGETCTQAHERARMTKMGPCPHDDGCIYRHGTTTPDARAESNYAAGTAGLDCLDKVDCSQAPDPDDCKAQVQNEKNDECDKIASAGRSDPRCK